MSTHTWKKLIEIAILAGSHQHSYVWHKLWMREEIVT